MPLKKSNYFKHIFKIVNPQKTPGVSDSSKIRNLLGWKAPFTLEEGVRETVKHYKS